jgi:hypothetical protein
MIVWGGRNGADVFGDGAAYTPVTGTWTGIAGPGASSTISARADSPPCMSKREEYLFGKTVACFLAVRGSH